MASKLTSAQAAIMLYVYKAYDNGQSSDIF